MKAAREFGRVRGVERLQRRRIFPARAPARQPLFIERAIYGTLHSARAIAGVRAISMNHKAQNMR